MFYTEETKLQAPQFPNFELEIRKAIKALRGEAFPKLNWSAPRVKKLLPLYVWLKIYVKWLCVENIHLSINQCESKFYKRDCDGTCLIVYIRPVLL